MKTCKLVIAVTFQVIGLFTLISAKTESLTAVPFQLITPAEFKAISELSDGSPFITQNRLLDSGSQVVNNIINNIVDGLISPVNITGLTSIFDSILKPTSAPAEGYPFCAIQTKRSGQHSQRSYDAIVDPASNFGTFSINFYHPGTVNIDNYDEDITIDELEPEHHGSKPNQPESSVPSVATTTTTTNHGPSDGGKVKPDSAAPVINCIVVLKEPSPPTTTVPPTTTTSTTPAPASTEGPSIRPSIRPSVYPQFPNHPHNPQYSIGPYQVIPIPYPPFLGLVGPVSGIPNWLNWPSGSQAFASNSPSPSFPYWPMVNPSAAPSANKNPWSYFGIPSQPASTHAPPSTSTFMPGSFWPAINPDAGNLATSPSIPIHSNPAAWFRPPAGAFNANHFIPQQQQYNANLDETRSVLDGESKENQVKTLIGEENVVDSVQRSHQKLQFRRMGETSKK